MSADFDSGDAENGLKTFFLPFCIALKTDFVLTMESLLVRILLLFFLVVRIALRAYLVRSR